MSTGCAPFFYPVAGSAPGWEVGGFKLWPTRDPRIVLFLDRQLRLARSAGSGRAGFALSQHGGPEGRITGGSALFTLATASPQDPASLVTLREGWRAALRSAGYEGESELEFHPLPTRNARIELWLEPESGRVSGPPGPVDMGTLGGTATVMVELTELGARQWSDGIAQRKPIPGSVRVTYEYPRMLPEAEAGGVKHQGWTWVPGRFEAELSELFQELDGSYITAVRPQATLPFSVTVQPHPQVSTVALSLSFSEGHSPEAPVFGPEGGTARYTVTSTRPEGVTVRYVATVNYRSASWPALQFHGELRISQGGGQLVLAPPSAAPLEASPRGTEAQSSEP